MSYRDATSGAVMDRRGLRRALAFDPHVDPHGVAAAALTVEARAAHTGPIVGIS
jgi:predicted nucleic acid-binding protein